MSLEYWDLLLLDRPASSSDLAAISGQEQKSFAVLPFLALPPGAVWPSTLRIIKPWKQYPNADLNLLLGIDFCINHDIDILSLSLGPSSDGPNAAPSQIATQTAYERGIPVVVAAGNWGSDVGTLRPLAQTSWVIAVGATDPGDQLLDSSSRGTPHGPCPTVVSNGSPAQLVGPPDPEWQEYGPGTSFAAPKVAHVAAWVRVCLRLILGNLSDQQAGKWSALSHPLRFPVVGLADTGVSPSHLPPHSQLAAYCLNQGEDKVRISRGEPEQQWYAQVVEALRQAGVACQVSAEPDTVKRAIELMARPLPGYARHEVGAGFVSDQEAETFLTAFTPTRWLQLFCPGAVHRLSEQMLNQLDSDCGPLWTRKEVQVHRALFGGGIRLVVARVVGKST
jgi:hypothetical protein